MKEHNTITELLAELVNVCESKATNALYHMSPYEIVNDFLKTNSLITEQPPENKDHCRCYRKLSNMHNSIEISMDKCNYCKGRISKK